MIICGVCDEISHLWIKKCIKGISLFNFLLFSCMLIFFFLYLFQMGDNGYGSMSSYSSKLYGGSVFHLIYIKM